MSQAIPLENSSNTLNDCSKSEDFDVVTDGEGFAEGESQATGLPKKSCTI
jgi:hypothetical protein